MKNWYRQGVFHRVEDLSVAASIMETFIVFNVLNSTEF